MLRSSRRLLTQALIASVLIHAVLLLGVVTLSPVQFDTPVATISVRINRDAPRAELAKPVSVPVPSTLLTEYKAVVSMSRKAPEPKAVVAERLTDTSAALSVPSAIADIGAATPAPSVPPSAGGTAPTPRLVIARDGISAEERSQFRLSLIISTKRFKQYPRLARERGWEGTVEVALNFSSRTSAPEIALTRSSGQSVLDEQALEMATRAAQVTTLPEGLKGRDFSLSLPVKFSLDDNQ